MTRDHRRFPHPGLIVFVILKLLVAIVPDLMRHAPDVVRAMPPPRVAADVAGDGLAGFDGAALGRAVERIGDVPVGDAIDLIVGDPGDED